MKPLAELDHYEILEISRGATPEQVERAYRLIRSAYAEDSVAAYSLLEEHDAQALRERIETAYLVLSDLDSRRAYDASLTPLEAGVGFEPPSEATAAQGSPPPASGSSTLDEIVPEEEDASWDGARLRRARLHRGAELRQISQITKINTNHLRCLEEETFEELPPAVYVRGFIIAYARCLRLDEARVAASYMQRYEAQHGSRRQGRRLGRLGA